MNSRGAKSKSSKSVEEDGGKDKGEADVLVPDMRTRSSRRTVLEPAEPEAVASGRSKRRRTEMNGPMHSPVRPHHAEDALGELLGEEDETPETFEAVVKVFCTHTEPNFSLPWQRKRQYSSTSTGFAIQSPQGERRLLTNAHSVEYHTQVKVKSRGSDTKYVARVLALGPECDLALLTVDDDNFWKDMVALRFGVLPKLQSTVIVVGYPIGGDTVSVTSGVVSRIEVTPYAHGASELLGVQIDAAINSGNSGGPAFNSAGECVGVAFQVFATKWPIKGHSLVGAPPRGSEAAGDLCQKYS
ncbi:hypothetical protein CYMTET_56808 [Cymbomonas tetramitiformis]|uniref:Protease Do-like 9 n=1 Tax=Cymbomonas tetramitiformis TaxID=36881 RepID=A0AAE0BA46_9CHLO|nr:hypothetical protein CYMTET_56808 [Cymbomonas tetramitiformis]